MLIDCQGYDPDKLYFLLIQTVIPRPIAWVLSDNGNDTYNLAPFSFFNALTSEPPLVMICAGWKSEEHRKDTWVNIDKRQDFVIHIPSEEHGPNVAASAAPLAHGESEIHQLKLKLEPVEGMRLPRVVGPKAVFFCAKHAIYEIGAGPQALIIGEIKKIWLDDAILEQKDNRLTVHYDVFNPLARLGGNFYTLLGKQLTIKRGER